MKPNISRNVSTVVQQGTREKGKVRRKDSGRAVLSLRKYYTIKYLRKVKAFTYHKSFLFGYFFFLHDGSFRIF